MGIATAAIAGFSLKVGANFEAGMSVVEAISGATGKELEDLTQLAREMGRQTKFSATESAEGLKYMAMAGWDAEQMMKGLPGVMMLAAASGEDLGLVTDIVTDSMTAFGYSADQSGRFADVLARTSTSTNTNVGMLGESFKYVASSAGALNYSIEDTALVLGAMANAGIKSSMAGTSLRGALQALKAPTGETLSAMNELGLSFYDSEGQAKPLRDVMEQLRGAMKDMTDEQRESYMSMLFGTRAAEGMSAILKVSEDDWNNLADGIDNSTGAAEEMHDIMTDNLMGDFIKMKSAAEGFGEALYRSFNFFRPVVQKATALINSATDFLEKLNAEGNTTADKFKMIAQAGKPLAPLLAFIGAAGASAFLLPGISKAASGIGGITKHIGLVTSQFSRFGGVAGKALNFLPQSMGKVTAGIKASGGAGLKLLSGSLKSMEVLVRAAMFSIGPAAIAGVALAGLGLLYSQFGDRSTACWMARTGGHYEGLSMGSHQALI